MMSQKIVIQVPVRCCVKEHKGTPNSLSAEAVHYSWLILHVILPLSPPLPLLHFQIVIRKDINGKKYNDFQLQHWSTYWAIAFRFIGPDIQTPNPLTLTVAAEGDLTSGTRSFCHTYTQPAGSQTAEIYQLYFPDPLYRHSCAQCLRKHSVGPLCYWSTEFW